ncbi:hypothetical protein B0E38_02554 [Streptomyces sp. 111WW2]|uniref:hypothetical protein n=1 Tax=Streptomyces sp. 111WW2 TaxID=1945515 RepID=UPI000D0C927B|nr:hypothetical protein [Streptomyces sp. 111WW2]PSK57023.1 hypothetical protein B0E38_02554 [Streptomyces sp. 111WW2]
MARTPSARKTSPAKKTATKKAPRPRKQTQPRPALASPFDLRGGLPTRTTTWMTDLQGYATLAALIAGITTPTIQAWHDHHDGTTTRTLNDGSHLHYTLTTRTLRWQTLCPMGAVHEYVLRNPADTDAAHPDAESCTRLHWTPPPTNTGTHLTARLQTASKATADTQPLTLADITDGLEARADHDQPKGHPQP